MHNFIINIFGFIKNVLHFLRLVCIFSILMLLLYWIQNLTHANWNWIGFIKPFLDWILDTANKMCSISFNMWGAEFEFKYISAIILLTLSAYAFKLLDILTNVLESLYRGTRMICKKTEQTLMNQKLHEDIKQEELKLTKYSVLIKTQIKKKFQHKEITINVDEQNKKWKDFLSEKTSTEAFMLNGAYMYQYNNFSNIDVVLDALFKLVNSNTPLDFAVCIQVGDDLTQLGKLIELEHYGKITMAADTAYRYRFNTSHRYGTHQIGVFQAADKTIEVHEFQPIL